MWVPMETEGKGKRVKNFNWIACAILVVISFPALCVAQSISRSAQSEEIAGVKAAEEALRQAQLKYDTAAARAILGDEFAGTWNQGEKADKVQFLSLIGDKASPLEILEYGQLEIRVYGNTAVVWSTIHEKAVYGGKPDEYRGRRTAVWVKRDKRWQCVTIHTSAFPEKGAVPKSPQS